MRSGLAALVLLLAGSVVAGERPAAGARRFALVIGNNTPDRPGRPLLHYADDDAVRLAELLRQAGARVELLVAPDEQTRQSAPRLERFAEPTRNMFVTAFARLRRDMLRALGAGRAVEFVFFFSGHGDVEHGEGYLVLSGWRLTRSELARLLSRSPAAANHVIIDACHSYFVAFGRGPGGRRAPAQGFVQRLAAGLSERNGFLLSTSTDRESHEWERFGAGVFSHLLLSALRGAADADGDGKLTYAELGGFFEAATSTIEPETLRPGFFLRPPGAYPGNLDAALLDWPEYPPRLRIDNAIGRGFLEDSAGRRLVDFHAAAQEMILVLPRGRPLFVRAPDRQREWTITGPERLVKLSELKQRKATALVAKGAVNRAFERLFLNPYRSSDTAGFRRQYGRAAALAVALAATLPEDAAEPERQQLPEPCPLEGRRRCRGDRAQLCALDELGQAVWRDLADCAREGGICRSGACRPPGFGGKIVFTSNLSGRREVWAVNDDGSGARRLSRWAESDNRFWGAYGPRWSPDGRRVAFSYGSFDGLRQDTPRVSRLVVINQDGSDLTLVSDDTLVPIGCLDWLDSNRLVVLMANYRDPCDGDLVAAEITSKGRQIILRDSPDGHPHPTSPATHPRERNLVLYRPYRCGRRDGGLRVLDIVSGGERVLALPGENHDGARWSPDGRLVAWLRPYRKQLATVDFRGGRVATVEFPELPRSEATEFFDWAEGGLVLATKPSPEAATSRLWVCDSDGRNCRLILDSAAEIGAVDWAPGRLGPFSAASCRAAAGHWNSDTAGGFGCWFAGTAGESCDRACRRQGLSCRQYDWNDFPNAKICSALTGEPAARVNNPAPQSIAPYLYLPPGTSHGCYHRPLDVRQDCAASPGPDRRRICLCGPFQ